LGLRFSIRVLGFRVFQQRVLGFKVSYKGFRVKSFPTKGFWGLKVFYKGFRVQGFPTKGFGVSGFL
jgi:hypothetical protein